MNAGSDEIDVRVYDSPDIEKAGEWFGKPWLDARQREEDGPHGSS